MKELAQLAYERDLSRCMDVLHGQMNEWKDGKMMVAFAWAIASGVGFWFVERHREHPMLDFRFFRQPTFAAANAASGLMNFGMFAMLFAFSLYLLRILRLTPEAVGIHLLVMFMPFALSLPFGGRITGRFGSRYPAAIGLGAGAAGLLLLSLVPGNSWRSRSTARMRGLVSMCL